MIALLLLLLSGQAKAEPYQLPYAYQLEIREDGVPLLYYEEKAKGGILSFRLKPHFKDANIPAAPLARALEGKVLGSSALISQSRCFHAGLYDLFCVAELTEIGERVLILSLNKGMLTLSVTINAEPKVELYPSAPVGSSFALAGSVQSSYFVANPIVTK